MSEGFTVTCNHCQKEVSNAISKGRFDEVYEERKTLKAQVAEFEKSGKSADKIASKLEAAEKALADATAKHTVDLAMLELGIKDPEVREAIEWQYGKLAPEGRKPIDETVRAWAEKPDEAPAVVRSLLPKPAATTTDTSKKTETQTQQRAGFGRHTNGLEGSGTSKGFEPGSLRAKRAAGTLTQADIDQAMAAVTGTAPPQQKSP